MLVEYVVKSVSNSEVEITLKRKMRKFIFFGEDVEEISQLRGSGTVWREYPNAKSIKPSPAELFCQIWKKYQWGSDRGFVDISTFLYKDGWKYIHEIEQKPEKSKPL